MTVAQQEYKNGKISRVNMRSQNAENGYLAPEVLEGNF